MDLDAPHWQEMQDLFHLARDAPPGERAAILAAASADGSLCERVLALLAAHDAAVAAGPPVEAAPAPLASIGPYRVLRCLGSGGTGSVYLVEREIDGNVQRAALKLLAMGWSEPVTVDRFHREERILASLHHPNIPRVEDSGLSETGQPYLVMEYVQGQQIDAWCDQRRLGIADRLRLFSRVCEAVAYAHRNLVVHLDLKPSNILVTDDGTPKLLDFGTSKLLQQNGCTTTAPLTPCYASPEQLRNEPVTTACDVYSLGAVLYELLAGKWPAVDSSIAAIVESAVEQREPARPDQVVTPEAAVARGLPEARLRAMLTGDLSTIVRKCLCANPAERYPSARALSDDIERYLDGLPVLARPQTTWYRLRKFVRRNRGRVVAVTAAAALLALVGAYAVWTQAAALREGQRALRMQTFLDRLFRVANSNYAGKPVVTVQEFLKMAAAVLPEYIKDPADLRAAQLSLAKSMYQNVDYADARELWERVARSAREAGDIGSEAEALASLGRVYMFQGTVQDALGYTTAALNLSSRGGVSPRTRIHVALAYGTVHETLRDRTDRNVRLVESAVRESYRYALPPHEIAQALLLLGFTMSARGRFDEAVQQYDEALRISRQDPVAVCEEAMMLEGKAAARWQQARGEEAARFAREANERFVQCHGPDYPEALSTRALWAGALIEAGRASEAISMLESSLPRWRKAFPPGNMMLIEPLYFLSLAYVEGGRPREAEPLAREGLALQAQAVAGDNWMARIQFVLGRALAGQEKYRDALVHLEQAERAFALPRNLGAGKLQLARVRVALEQVRRELGETR